MDHRIESRVQRFDARDGRLGQLRRRYLPTANEVRLRDRVETEGIVQPTSGVWELAATSIKCSIILTSVKGLNGLVR